MRVVLVRHGETVENREGICQGQTEGRLSELGVLQAWLTAGELKNTNIDLCISSDLKRAIETAEIILTGRDIYIDKEPSLRERTHQFNAFSSACYDFFNIARAGCNNLKHAFSSF